MTDLNKKLNEQGIDTDKVVGRMKKTVESEMSNLPPAVQEFIHKQELETKRYRNQRCREIIMIVFSALAAIGGIGGALLVLIFNL